MATPLQQKKFLAQNPGPVSFTNFSRSEAFHAIRHLVFKRSIDLGEMTRAMLQFDQDEAAGFLVAVTLDDELIFHKADQLSNRHATTVGVRYLDILHVASALLTGAQDFLTFDARQGKLATMVGLNVKPSLSR